MAGGAATGTKIKGPVLSTNEKQETRYNILKSWGKEVEEKRFSIGRFRLTTNENRRIMWMVPRGSRNSEPEET